MAGSSSRKPLLAQFFIVLEFQFGSNGHGKFGSRLS